MDAPPPRKTPRRPPSLRWARVIHASSIVIGAFVLMVAIIMIRPGAFTRQGWVPFLIIALNGLHIVFLQVHLLRVRWRLADKAPGMCPVCEYALGMTRATAGETPILCPECGYQDTAQGVKAFWTKHLGEPLP